MKKVYVFIIVIALCFISGCSQLGLTNTEIDKIFVVRIIAIDRIGENKVRIVLTTKSINQGNMGTNGGQSKSEMIVADGETVFEASRLLLTYADKRPHYGHTEFILFGEDTAKDGILPYLDFVSRNPEFRYNAKIYIVRDSTAFDFITKTSSGDTYLGDKLISLEEDAPETSISTQVSLTEALYIFDKKSIATYLPCLHIHEGTSKNEVEVSLHGYAVFKEDKLYTVLNDDLSRGISWIRNLVVSGVILIDAPDGKKVSMEIIESKTKIIPRIDKNGMSCTIKIMFNSNIAESMSRVNIFTLQYIPILESKQEEVVKKEIEQILKYAQEQNLDMFSIISKFIMKYPSSKNELREKWGELFPEINFNVEVESNINRSYLLRESTGTK